MSFTQMMLPAGVLSLVLMLAAGPLFKAGLPLPAAFGLMGIGAALGALTGLAGVLAALSAARRGQPIPLAVAGGIVLGLLAFAMPAQRVWAARKLPVIHDISTDLADPPTFQAVLPLRGDSANPVTFDRETGALQRGAYPDIQPVALPLPPTEAFARALAAARDAGWDIVRADEAALRIEATDRTRWFGFKDDIAIRLTPEAAGTRVDVRSLSRLGRGDLGTNAARVRAYLASLR